MKHYTNILLAVFLMAGLNSAKANSVTDYTFTIHVGAFVNPQLADFENIQPFGFLYAQTFQNLKQVYMGDYTTEGEASKVLINVKDSGYPDAFVTRRNLDKGSSVTVIQLGAETIGAPVNWGSYTKAGPLHMYQNGKALKIVTGPFNDLDGAQGRLNLLKKSGFPDAFIKSVNNVLLHEVTAFETGNSIDVPKAYDAIVVPTTPTDEEIVIAEIPPKKKSIPNVFIQKKEPKAEEPSSRDEPRPTSYGDDILVAKSPVTESKVVEVPAAKTKVSSKKIVQEKTFAVPDIQTKVKRTSVLRLQEELKTKGVYDSGLDGYFGAGTKKAMDQIMTNDQEIEKYQLLTQWHQKKESQNSELQMLVFEMGEEVVGSVSKLKSIRSPFSKAYQALGIFKLSGKNQETDRLMNEAIAESFSSKRMQNKTPFDYKKKYSYEDYNKLIRHLRYIHSNAEEKLQVPCWLFEQHEKAAVFAFDPGNDLAAGDYVLQDCGNIRSWESIALLETIMKDMTPDLSKLNAKEMAQLQSKRATMLLSPQAQSIEAYKNIDQWNTKLWDGLKKWAAADPLHSRKVDPLKIAYFHSWALLEDHFMNRGFTPKEARGLSLEVLKTIVNPYLSRYSE